VLCVRGSPPWSSASLRRRLGGFRRVTPAIRQSTTHVSTVSSPSSSEVKTPRAGRLLGRRIGHPGFTGSLAEEKLCGLQGRSQLLHARNDEVQRHLAGRPRLFKYPARVHHRSRLVALSARGRSRDCGTYITEGGIVIVDDFKEDSAGEATPNERLEPFERKHEPPDVNGVGMGEARRGGGGGAEGRVE